MLFHAYTEAALVFEHPSGFDLLLRLSGSRVNTSASIALGATDT